MLGGGGIRVAIHSKDMNMAEVRSRDWILD